MDKEKNMPGQIILALDLIVIEFNNILTINFLFGEIQSIGE